MSTANRAEQLAIQILDAIGSARADMRRAVQAADRLDHNLGLVGAELRGLPAYEDWQTAADFKVETNIQGRNIRLYLERSTVAAEDERRYLGTASDAVATAKRFLDELENLAASSTPRDPDGAAVEEVQRATAALLRERLTGLETAIETAAADAEQTPPQLDRLRESNNGLIRDPTGQLNLGDDPRTVTSIEEARHSVEEDFEGIGTARATRVAGDRAEGLLAGDLATAFKAGSTPRPTSAQQTSATVSEQDHRDRGGGPSRGSQLNR